jgi:hypothetical protein
MDGHIGGSDDAISRYSQICDLASKCRNFVQHILEHFPVLHFYEVRMFSFPNIVVKLWSFIARRQRIGFCITGVSSAQNLWYER